MKFVAVVLFVLAAVVALSSAVPAGNKCAKTCSFDYDPICAGPEQGADKPVSFGNECVLSNFNCENNKNYVLKSRGECPNSKGVRLS